MSSGPSIIRRPASEKSNIELINSLRSNIEASKLAFRELLTDGSEDSFHTQESWINSRKVPFSDWTAHKDGILYVPAIDFSQSGLVEERSEYNITVKLFLLPGTSLSKRYNYAQEAVGLVLQELHVPSIDLLIVSFPGVSFDGDDEEEQEESETREKDTADDIESMVETWRALEQLHANGLALQIGVSEFGSERLAKFLPGTVTRPSVDQINVRDCCVVPKSLILYAKEQNIELLTHNDCTNILSRGTVRELLGSGEKGAGVLVGPNECSDELNREVEPRWVVKYTAVIRDRGVIENKGYFAAAELYD
ncbi:hypothetical protein MMC31_003107 [Peltigera leucophlebia]|nr:hypothetical protein [Peltigera leucophlebia]